MLRLFKGVVAFNRLVGQAVAWLTLAMTLLVSGIAILRYGFDLGSIALQELVLYLHATLFLLAAAWTLRVEGHVRVDLLYQRLSPKGRALVDLFGALFLLLPMAGFIFWISLPYVEASWAIREGSREAGGLPFLYLLKTLIPVAAGMLLLEGLVQICQSFKRLWKG